MAQLPFDQARVNSYSKYINEKRKLDYEQQLQTLAREMTDVLLNCDVYHPWVLLHIAEDFIGTHDLAPRPLAISRYMEYIRYLKVLYPGSRILIAEEWVIDFDESQSETRAVVWQFARVKLDLEGVVKSRLGMSYWRLQGDGNWVCYRYGIWRCDALALGRVAPRFGVDY